MGEPVRHSVVFEDSDLLRAPQRRRGQQRCWLNLRPGTATIADLSAHLHPTFGLQSSCPYGLIISMDGFVLPSFESTCILKDEDIIMSESNGNDGGHVSKNDVNGDAGKVPSRSARRKKAKRLLYRTLKKEKKVEQETTLKQLSKTMDLRATPMPSFYQEGPPPDTELKKVPSKSSRRKKAKRLLYRTLKKEKKVGRVSSYDCSSSKVVLLPLPEYPLLLKEMSDDGQESRSLYKEDGTLEVDFASLVDVRLFKARESKEIAPNTTPIEEIQNAAPGNGEEMRHAAPVNNQKSASCNSCNRIEIRSNHTVNDQLSEWDAINQALNEKKSQLQKQNDLDRRNSSLGTTTTGPWSYRALRRNALGPTLAMLRSSNGDTDK